MWWLWFQFPLEEEVTCLPQHTEDHCSPRGNTAAREKVDTDTECSATTPWSAFEEPTGGKQNFMKNSICKDDALS